MTSLRKLRTRTLIQLGGLVEKSGLLNALDIPIGGDLQKDENLKEATAVLLGALYDNAETLQDESQRFVWLQKGKQLFAESLLKKLTLHVHLLLEPSAIVLTGIGLWTWSTRATALEKLSM